MYRIRASLILHVTLVVTGLQWLARSSLSRERTVRYSVWSHLFPTYINVSPKPYNIVPEL
ncbi:hypothetical protein M758_UG068200 [Ceratodon purpureus]|nr:hypothetical protein M758_UG068200 [Ceratodon purpureus]